MGYAGVHSHVLHSDRHACTAYLYVFICLLTGSQHTAKVSLGVLHHLPLPADCTLMLGCISQQGGSGMWDMGLGRTAHCRRHPHAPPSINSTHTVRASVGLVLTHSCGMPSALLTGTSRMLEWYIIHSLTNLIWEVTL